MSALDQFREDWRALGALLRRYPESETASLRENLYWYDLSLEFLNSPEGLAHIEQYNRQSEPQRDDNAQGYGVSTIYFREPLKKESAYSKSTVWDYRGLSSVPWALANNKAELVLEKSADEVVAEYTELKAKLDSATSDELHGMGVYRQDESTADSQAADTTPYFADQGTWQGMYLYSINGKNDALCALCPITTALIEQLPLNYHFGFTFFSDLLPGSHILGHYGSSNLRLRCHLGVQVPEPDDVEIIVGGESRRWQQGRCMFFDDSYWHEVFHRGQQLRAVLIVDLWHPKLSATEVAILSDPLFQTFGKVPIAA
jgi:ElaB/YqjD/DUF883 family membrane-anchored ribosome-binding protein